MDNKKDVRLYKDCSELPMHNFEEARKDNNFKWLVYGYDGWGDIEVPEKTIEIWDDILNEYAALTKNNKTIQYFEIWSDLSDLETRIIQANVLLFQLESRPQMEKQLKESYIKELGKWHFFYNSSKDHNQEIKRLKKHIGVVKTKLVLLESDKENFEKKNKTSDLIKIKVAVQNILKRDIDLRKISVKEWIITLDNLPKA